MLEKGYIVNEFDEVVGTFEKLTNGYYNGYYYVKLHGNVNYYSESAFNDKLMELDLYIESDADASFD